MISGMEVQLEKLILGKERLVSVWHISAGEKAQQINHGTLTGVIRANKHGQGGYRKGGFFTKTPEITARDSFKHSGFVFYDGIQTKNNSLRQVEEAESRTRLNRPRRGQQEAAF